MKFVSILFISATIASCKFYSDQPEKIEHEVLDSISFEKGLMIYTYANVDALGSISENKFIAVCSTLFQILILICFVKI